MTQTKSALHEGTHRKSVFPHVATHFISPIPNKEYGKEETPFTKIVSLSENEYLNEIKFVALIFYHLFRLLSIRIKNVF